MKKTEKKNKVCITLTTAETKKIFQALIEAETVIKVMYDDNTLVSVSKALKLLSLKIAEVKK